MVLEKEPSIAGLLSEPKVVQITLLGTFILMSVVNAVFLGLTIKPSIEMQAEAQLLCADVAMIESAIVTLLLKFSFKMACKRTHSAHSGVYTAQRSQEAYITL